MRLLAADRWRGAGINGKFEVEDRKLDACTVKAIPVGFDDVNDSLVDLRSNIEADNKVLVELG